MHHNQQVRKITTGYQVTIPNNFRKNHNLNIGSMVSIYTDGEKLIIEPFQHKSEALRKLKALFNDVPKEFKQLSESEISEMVSKEIRSLKKNDK